MLKYLPKDTLAQWALGSVVVAGAASVAYVLIFSESAPELSAPEFGLVEPLALSAPEAEDSPEMQIALAAPLLDLAPRFDLVRVTDLGDVLIAGQAPARSAISALIDEDPVAQSISSAEGEFVLMFVIDTSPVPRVLELEVRLPGGERVRSLDTLMLAPRSDMLAQTVDGEITPRSMGRPVDVAPLFPQAQAPERPAALPQDALAEPPEAASAPAPQIEPRAAPTAILMRADGSVQNLGPAPGLDPQGRNVSIDAISYTAQGEVSLTGRTASGSSDIQIYIDNQPILRARAAPDGNWQAQLDGIERGVYRLRVDEIDDQAQVTSRAEIPFARETPEIAAEAARPQALIVQPGNTLWGMSEARFGDGRRYMRIFDANRDQIRNPDLIFPGQVIVLPEDEP
ncbi:MAG: LysM peptidoglycan-binding domain-containing protein [Rhodobacteraceae bacterium]|nr:MAG: LysM peptidoglycan-binding domain-containing protein [Paracoccaceae bacterium]